MTRIAPTLFRVRVGMWGMRTSKYHRAPRALAAGWSILLLAAPVAASAQVISADEICAPTAAPCVIRERVRIADGADLDFGQRGVLIESGGRLDVGAGSATIRCGELIADAPRSTVIDINGREGDGVDIGGTLQVVASRACSATPTRACTVPDQCTLGTCSQGLCSADTSRLCASDGQCNFGPCGAHACAGDRDRACTADDDCSFGGCNRLTQRCARHPGIRCIRDYQCEFGPCDTGVDLCSADLDVTCGDDSDCDAGSCSVTACSGDPQFLCSADADCDHGSCTLGSGAVDIGGRIRADGAEAGEIVIVAAGDIVLRERVAISAHSLDSDAGLVELKSGLGSVAVLGPIDASGGKEGSGGDVTFEAAEDILIAGELDLNGGDFDGGFLDIEAKRDVTIQADVRASSRSGEGAGGIVSIDAGRDFALVPGVRIQANGHKSDEGFGGDGGEVSVFAGRHIDVPDGVRLQTLGGRPDGFGDRILLDAGGDLTVGARLEARGRGRSATGGTIDLAAVGSIDVGDSARLTVGGSAEEPGDIAIDAEGPVSIGGKLVAGRKRVTGEGLFIFIGVFIESDQDIELRGSISVRAAERSETAEEVYVRGCNVLVDSSAKIRNRGTNSTTVFEVERTLTVAAGARMDADRSTGVNTFRHREPSDPPVIDGRVRPAPTVAVDSSIRLCR